MINFKNWLEEGGAISPNLNPNSPNNPQIAAQNIANKAFVTTPVNQSVQLATANSPEKVAKTALSIAQTAMKHPSNQKNVSNVTPVNVAGAITKGITGKPMPSASMPTTKTMMSKK